MSDASIRAHFAEQAALCEIYGSPLTARLIERMAADFDAGGPLASLLRDWPGSPRLDAVTMRVCGALHAAALTGRDPALEAEYPEQRGSWEINTLWPRARAFFEREQAWVAEFIRSAPQTNEVRRSIALLPGFLAFAGSFDGPIDMLEIGASAGLNLNWDKFSYKTDSFALGASGGVAIDTDWHGPALPEQPLPRIRSRAACDLNPLAIADRTQRLQLRSYIWADQRDRLARFDAAAALAIASGVQVERADAAEWLAQRLSARATDAGTIVYHSVFLQYPPKATRAAIVDAIESAGACATDAAPLAWLRLEPEAMFGGPRDSVRFLVDMVTWPGNRRRVLAVTDGHARSVEHIAGD